MDKKEIFGLNIYQKSCKFKQLSVKKGLTLTYLYGRIRANKREL